MARFPGSIVCFTLLLSFAASAAWAGEGARSTGAYRVRQAADGRWWFADPEGKAFYSLGVNCLNPEGDFSPRVHKSPYRERVLSKYGSRQAWAKATNERLRDWGWNTAGAWSAWELFPELAHTDFVGCSSRYLGELGMKQMNAVPDYFAPEYATAANLAAAEATARHRGDRMLLGYFLDNELNWGNDYRNPVSLFDQYFAFPPEAPGKRAVLEFLKEHYPSIAELNQAWGSSYETFEELATLRRVPASAKKLKAYDVERSLFLLKTARRYFEVCSQAIRARDPDHLLLGARFMSTFSFEEVVHAAGETQDVISVNRYDYSWPSKLTFPIFRKKALSDDQWLEDFHRVSGRPLLISEFGYRAFEPKSPGSWPPIFPLLSTQKVRARKFDDYIRGAWSAPYILGYQVFQYADQPFWGRFDGENSNWGLVNIDDEPYSEVTAVFQTFHREVSRAAYLAW